MAGTPHAFALRAMQPIHVTFSGGRRVDARSGPFVIHTDQPVDHGGEGAAPDPFTLFLASLATCAGYYVLAFCQARGISTEGLRADLEPHAEPNGRLSRVRLHVGLPTDFPHKYIDSARRAAETCKVKALLANPPIIEVTCSIHSPT